MQYCVFCAPHFELCCALQARIRDELAAARGSDLRRTSGSRRPHTRPYRAGVLPCFFFSNVGGGGIILILALLMQVWFLVVFRGVSRGVCGGRYPHPRLVGTGVVPCFVCRGSGEGALSSSSPCRARCGSLCLPEVGDRRALFFSLPYWYQHGSLFY